MELMFKIVVEKTENFRSRDTCNIRVRKVVELHETPPTLMEKKNKKNLS